MGKSIFQEMTSNTEWLGYGYLGERRDALCDEMFDEVRRGDQMVLEAAHAQNWTAAELFAWCNSKLGRHAGEELFRSGADPVCVARLVRRLKAGE